jgi:hypothetical protein
LLGSAPTFGSFFALYQPIKSILLQPQALGGHQDVAVLLASLGAGVPSSLIGVPSDVLKKRIILQQESPSQALQFMIRGFRHHINCKQYSESLIF